MEIPQIPKTDVSKRLEDTAKSDAAQSKKAKEGDKAESKSDTVSLSSRAKLLQHLRAKYDELPDVRKDKVEDLKHRIEEGSHRLSSEEIVRTILQGALFKTE